MSTRDISDEPRGPGPRTIELAIAAWQRAQAQLAADPDLEADEAAVLASLGAPSDLPSPDELLGRMIRALLFVTLRGKEAAALLAMIEARKARYARRAEALRTELFGVMSALGKTRFTAPEATLSIRRGTASALILDPEAIPDDYIELKRVPNRAAILADLKEGVLIDGCALSNGAPTLALHPARPLTDQPDPEAEED